MSGVVLGRLRANDMLDVLHFMFEEYFAPEEEEMAEARHKLRSSAYLTFLDRTYPYPFNKSSKKSGSNNWTPEQTYADMGPLSEAESAQPFTPQEIPVKPYTPVTDFDPTAANPFGGILEGPMSH